MEWTERTLTVGELRDIWFDGKSDIEISTPDGWQPVVSWWDKGVLPMVTVCTDSFTTLCATNHLIETLHGDTFIWVLASELAPGMKVLTTNGVETVIEVSTLPDDEECFDFEVGHDNHRYWGDGFSSHNSGKSYIGTANLIIDCLKKGVYPIVVDTENALDESWLRKFDIDTEQVYKVSAATVDDLAAFLSAFIEQYKEQNGAKPYKDRPPVLVIVDSLGMLITGNMEKQFDEGDQKGDLGLKAKQITALVRVFMAKIACERIGMVVTNHVYDSQDKYTPDKISGGKMLEFATSIIIQMNKLLLKEDEDGKEIKEVAGIKSSIVVRKSRYSKPFEKLKINIPYDTGMDPYSGLFELFEKKGILEKSGVQYIYTSPETGEVFKEYRKNYRKKGILDQIMAEWSHWETTEKPGFNDFVGEEEDSE